MTPHTKRLACLLLACQLFISFNFQIVARDVASHGDDDAGTARAKEIASGDDEAASHAKHKGLRFRLSKGEEQAKDDGGTNATKLARTERLSDAETEQILKRLPPLEVEEKNRQELALRENSLPPPRAARTVSVAFPPAAESSGSTPPKSVNDGAPLEVLRLAPEGEVGVAAQLSVTFSQPMVALTSQSELSMSDVPVKLSPQPAGRWRWVGTRTLLFEPQGRFPAATRYTATVPAGARAVNGATLSTARAWSFATPPPRIVASYPSGDSQPRDTLIFVVFDQRIDPASALRSIHVRAGVGGPLALRLATEQEVKTDEELRRRANEADAVGAGRWLAFRVVGTNGAATELPVGARVSVEIAAGTPSAEGPLVTTKPQAFAFRTYGALRVTRSECGDAKRCTPFDPLRVTLSNNIDEDAFQKSQVRVEPAIPDAKIEIEGDRVSVEGIKRSHTIYRVTLSREIKDQFGQTLSRDETVTFRVGAARSALAAATDEPFVVLDPYAPPRFSVFSVNYASLRCRLYRVAPEDWDGFARTARERSFAGNNTTLPGTLLHDQIVEVKSKADELVESQIDLAPALADGMGQLLVVVEPANGVVKSRRRVVAWVQATRIGLDAFADGEELRGWATSLRDGAPLAGVSLKIQPTGAESLTGADGLARLALQSAPSPTPKQRSSSANAATDEKPVNLLVARLGKDVAILPEHFEPWDRRDGWHRREAADGLRWYVFDDRKMYRPGEEVHIKGWVRSAGDHVGGDIALAREVREVSYVLEDSRENEITKGTLSVNTLGGFDAVLKLPRTMNLGAAWLTLTFKRTVGDEEEFKHRFEVQEFRRPEFEVTTKSDEGVHVVGSHAEATVAANYFAGGGLADAPVRWRVTSTPSNFTPPNRDDFTFGKWRAWWRDNSGEDGETHTETFEGRTGADGKQHLRIDFDSIDPPRATSVTAEAHVEDVNRQQWSATTTMLVHPSTLYVGLRSPRTFVREGEPLTVESIVTDLEGRAVSDRPVDLRAVRLDWVYEKDEWRERETDEQTCSVHSKSDAVACTFPTKGGGTYRVEARVSDDAGRANESELTLWVAGGHTPPKRGVEQESVELIPDRKSYHAGDTAEILLQSPFFPAEGVMTLRRNGLVRTERFRVDSPSYTLRVPIEEGYVPNVHVQVDLVGAAPRVDDEGQRDARLPKRPAYAKGELNLEVPPRARKLQVSATPRERELEPGAETSVDVEVRDAAGHAVAGSELVVVVADEAVLALTNYKLTDPLSVFYAARDADVTDYHSREKVQLGKPEDLLTGKEREQFIESYWRRRGGGGAGGGGQLSGMFDVRQIMDLPINGRAFDTLSLLTARTRPAADKAPAGLFNVVTRSGTSEEQEAKQIRLRENFNALAVFAASVPTDDHGRARVAVKLPDNLTRYRVMAVAVAGEKQFGAGESAITARSPLMVRPSAPRFLNFGDRAELPVVVQNQTDKPLEVSLAVRASNAVLTDGAGRRLTVAANNRAEVRFPVAADRAGVAHFQIGAVAGALSDAAEVSLPVWTPATSETFATYGVVDDASGVVAQPVKAPANVLPQFGGLEVTTSSTELQELTDALLYLVAYPYECSEQLSSRILAIASLGDVLAAFKTKDAPTPEEMREAVARDIKRLQSMQNEDGGFGFWRRGEKSVPYVSVHVANALAQARAAGFDVPDELIDNAEDYLKEIDKRIPAKYPMKARLAITAYALNVRLKLGDRDAARARRLVAEAGIDNLPLEATGWLLPVLFGDAASRAQVASLRRQLQNRAVEDAATVHFVTSYGEEDDYLLLHSARRADAVVLDALIADQPTSDLIPKLVRGLLGGRVRGRWSNTQENVFALVALSRYFRTYERIVPDFTARAWLGNAFAGEMKFAGRTTERQRIDVPMNYLLDKSKQSPSHNITLAKEGAGRLYYRVGMTYAPANLKLDAADYGFAVERTYEAVDDPKDVRRDSDGTWHVRAGARVRVRITMQAPVRRYHVALVDPIPAGLEALNPALAVTGEIPEDEKDEAAKARRAWWWSPVWFEHQNLRDERAEAFASLLGEGVYTYSYVARATTPGAFLVPPAKAEEMYHPEVFGRGATDRVVVDEK
jgi:uncharacterized protein YfaS (alpha-2-macroglobulin family)